MTVSIHPEFNPLPIINIAAYKFVTLDDLPRWRREVKSLCQDLSLLGTVLLSPEGINLFLAGSRASVDLFVRDLRARTEFHDLPVKESPSETQPFHRLLVKLKREIIPFGIAGVDPAHGATAARISPRELKQWLDEGRPVTLLDTRNDYETRLGTFAGAIDLNIGHFRQFPDAVQRLPEALRQQPVVMYCTGGIRCEKAGPFMQQAGFRNILQLDGGILKYFEDCGGDHWQGECFVFDQRVAVDPQLRETATRQCFACLTPLTPEDQLSEKYAPGQHCPHCFQSAEQVQQQIARNRFEQIQQAACPLPGSRPADTFRPLNVPLRYDGRPLLDMLDGLHPHIGRATWARICQAGNLLNTRREPVCAEIIVRAGEQLFHRTLLTVEPDVNAEIRVLYEDDWIVAINKPAPLPVHPCGRFQRNTLVHILNEVYRPQKLRPAHRLDANTTGVLVLSRSRSIASRLQPQFDRQQIQKTYLACVHGHPGCDEFRSDAAISTQATVAGGRLPDSQGLPAATQFRVRKRFAQGQTLLEVTPLTGRTNQIRLHLWDLGLPIVGDPLYLPDRQLGNQQTLDHEAPTMFLHAWRMTFLHPFQQNLMTIEAPPPRHWYEPDSAPFLQTDIPST